MQNNLYQQSLQIGSLEVSMKKMLDDTMGTTAEQALKMGKRLSTFQEALSRSA